MTRDPTHSLNAKAARKKKKLRGALYHHRKQLGEGSHPRAVLTSAAGAQLADDLLTAIRRATLDDAVREREPRPRKSKRWPGRTAKGRAERARVTFRDRDRQHPEHAPHIRRFTLFVLYVLERVHVETKVSASNELWLGNSWTSVFGDRAYVRQSMQLGMALKLGCSIKTIERYIAVLVASGLFKVWQPQEKGAVAPVDMPRHLRGDVYAYQHYKLVGEVPRELAEHIHRRYKVKPPPAAQRVAAAEPAESQTEREAEAEHYAAVAAALRARANAPAKPAPVVAPTPPARAPDGPDHAAAAIAALKAGTAGKSRAPS